MTELQRQSPVRFKVAPSRTQVRDNWTVALSYDEQGQGPWLVDLAHKTRWDFQAGDMDARTVCELAIPAAPGQCAMSGDVLIARMGNIQAAIYHLGTRAPAMPDDPGYTDVTESTVFLALFGPQVFMIAEKLSNLDFLAPGKQTPFLYQGPFCHVPCQVVTMARNNGDADGLLLTCSRGYADSMVEALLEAGEQYGLQPAGEDRFSMWREALERAGAVEQASAASLHQPVEQDQARQMPAGS